MARRLAGSRRGDAACGGRRIASPCPRTVQQHVRARRRTLSISTSRSYFRRLRPVWIGLHRVHDIHCRLPARRWRDRGADHGILGNPRGCRRCRGVRLGPYPGPPPGRSRSVRGAAGACAGCDPAACGNQYTGGLRLGRALRRIVSGCRYRCHPCRPPGDTARELDAGHRRVDGCLRAWPMPWPGAGGSDVRRPQRPPAPACCCRSSYSPPPPRWRCGSANSALGSLSPNVSRCCSNTTSFPPCANLLAVACLVSWTCRERRGIRFGGNDRRRVEGRLLVGSIPLASHVNQGEPQDESRGDRQAQQGRGIGTERRQRPERNGRGQPDPQLLLPPRAARWRRTSTRPPTRTATRRWRSPCATGSSAAGSRRSRATTSRTSSGSATCRSNS